MILTSPVVVAAAVWSSAFFTRAAADTSCGPYPSLYSATLEELSFGLENRCFKSVDLVNGYISRIGEVNDTLHAVFELNPDAVTIASKLDAERVNGTTRGKLHGIPVLVKDNIATFDEMNNTAGSYALMGAKVPRDSSVVSRLREDGAIILGKTSMSQWAMFRSSNSTSGWSSVVGQVYGPYYPHQDPCGSSSGSGIAAGIGLSFAALGTETRGSILEPASRSNAVGIKPTVGLTSRYLVIPISEFQDTVGPLARTVRDAASVLSVIAGFDERDEGTSSIPNNGRIPDYVAAADSVKHANSSLAGVRIGIPRNGFSSDLLYQQVNETIIHSSFSEAVEVLRSLGAEVIESTNFTEPALSTLLHGFATPFTTNETISTSSGFNSGLPAYLAELTANPNSIHDLSDLMAYTESDPREAYPDRDIAAWEGAKALGYGIAASPALAAHHAAIEADEKGGVTGILREYNLSALIIPTDYAPTWVSSPGLPGISVPLGMYPNSTPVLKGLRELVDVAPGIPFGLTFLGKRWDEEGLIRIAAAYEKAARPRDVLLPKSSSSGNGGGSTLPSTEIKDVVGSTYNTTQPTVVPSVAPAGVKVVPFDYLVPALVTSLFILQIGS